jgi:FkbM family methyltransferase
MKILSQFTLRLWRLSRYIEQPSLWKLRQQGIGLEAYDKLARPWLLQEKIATILDIGANSGQFAALARFVMPDARIYSFEPLPECFEQLERRLAGAPRFRALNIGLGERAEMLVMERNACSASSSLLKMTEIHKTAFPSTEHCTPLRVRVERLDDVVKDLDIEGPLLIKIDVQGYEDRVLRGGEQTARKAKVIIAETSFERLYENQPLFGEIHALLSGWGFRYTGAIDELCHPDGGRPLQVDAVFVKSQVS